jgi:hypothetical protein
MINAPQKAFIITPPRSNESFPGEERPPERISTAPNINIDPRNEKRVTPGKKDTPNSIPLIAPTAEPPDMPRI